MEKEINVTQLVVTHNKEDRLALQPAKGWMAVQKDEHQRHYFDGEEWRLYQPGTKRHLRRTGKPKPPEQIKKERIAAEAVHKKPEEPIKKKLTKLYVVAAVVAIVAITIILITNAI